MFGFEAEEYIKMGKPGPDDVPEKTAEQNKKEENIEDTEVVKPEDIQLNIGEKDTDIENNLEKENVGEVKEILTDEKLMTAEENIWRLNCDKYLSNSFSYFISWLFK